AFLKPIARALRPPELPPLPERLLGPVPTVLDIQFPFETFDLDVTDYSKLEGLSSPPAKMDGWVVVRPGRGIKEENIAEVLSGSLTVRLMGRNAVHFGVLADVALVNVYASDESEPVDLGNFSISKGVFYLHEQTLWYGSSFSQIIPDPESNPALLASSPALAASASGLGVARKEPPPAPENPYIFPPPATRTKLNYSTPYPFSFPIPLDAPVTARAAAGRITWTLEATLVQAGRHWPLVRKVEVQVRRIARDPRPQTVPPTPARPLSGPLPRKTIVMGLTADGAFEYEVQFPDPVRVPPEYEHVEVFHKHDSGATTRGRDRGRDGVRSGGTRRAASSDGGQRTRRAGKGPAIDVEDDYYNVAGPSRARSTSTPPAPPPIRRRRMRDKERNRSTGRPDDELLGPDGVPVQVCIKNGTRNVGTVHAVEVSLAQRCHINPLDRFRPPPPASILHGTLGLWEDFASDPIAMPVAYQGENPPPPPPTDRLHRRSRQEFQPNHNHYPMHHRPNREAPDIAPAAGPAPANTTGAPASDRIADDGIVLSEPSYYLTARLDRTPRTIQPPPSLATRHGRPGLAGTLRDLRTAGTIVSVRPGRYRFLRVPTGRGAGKLIRNGIGGNLVANPPLVAGSGGNSRRNSLAVLADGVGNVNKKVASAAGFGGDGTRYVIEVGDGDAGGECSIGVEVMLDSTVQASVVQQNFKIAHYLILTITYISEKKNLFQRNIKERTQVEIPVLVVHGAPPMPVAAAGR
ncbi:hypothetical protein HK101_012062, partial [Irineochytrium annulatum]